MKSYDINYLKFDCYSFICNEEMVNDTLPNVWHDFFLNPFIFGFLTLAVISKIEAGEIDRKF